MHGIFFFIVGVFSMGFVSFASAQEFPEFGIKVETVAENLKIPWEIDFAPDGRIFFTERIGNLRIIENNLVSAPILSLKVSGSEGGLLGLALDPDFEENHYLYLYYSYSDFFDIYNRVVRYVESDNNLSDEMILLDKIPGSQIHDGGRIKFGPDGKLYITTGYAANSKMAQNLDSLSGKILRINSDGTIPEDNPFPNSPIYSYGHRNPQGIDWHPVSEIFVSTEHGPSIIDGPPGGDEVNIIKKGQNYGWPLVSHEKNKEGLIGPKIIFTPAVAPASGTFYSGVVFPQFKNHFLFGGLKGEGIFRVVFAENTPETIVAYEKLSGINVGRIRAITEGPDGFIYFSTSNRDGKSETRDGDDRIYR